MAIVIDGKAYSRWLVRKVLVVVAVHWSRSKKEGG
jgi:hypothetical protein